MAVVLWACAVDLALVVGSFTIWARVCRPARVSRRYVKRGLNDIAAELARHAKR